MALKVDGRLVVVREDDDETELKIEVPASGFEIDEPEVHDADRQMGPELVHRVSAALNGIGEAVWHVFEYPVGVINHIEAPTIDGDVQEEPTFSLT